MTKLYSLKAAFIRCFTSVNLYQILDYCTFFLFLSQTFSFIFFFCYYYYYFTLLPVFHFLLPSLVTCLLHVVIVLTTLLWL